jgi:hypothetical protein
VGVCVYYQVTTSIQREPATNTTAASASDSGPTSSSEPASLDAVQSLSANRLLAEQLNKHKDTVRELTTAKDTGDMAAFVRILSVRSRELADVIDKVQRGSYSTSDKTKMLRVLEQEREWADSSIAAFSR